MRVERGIIWLDFVGQRAEGVQLVPVEPNYGMGIT